MDDASPEPKSKLFKRLRSVQATLGSLKRVHGRNKREPVTPPPVEASERIPPYKELYLQTQNTEEVLNALHHGYFEKDFDPIAFELKNTEDAMGQEEVDAKVDQLTAALEVVGMQLSQRVTEKHEEFVNGIETVASIESDLQQAHVQTVNARIKVRLALEEVKCSAAIARQTKQKQRYLEVLSVLDSVKQCLKLKQSLRDVLENGDYIEAMMMCAECFDKLETLGTIKIALDLKQNVHLLYLETLDRIDAALNATCTDFRPDEYKNILQCFLFQEITVNDLSEKILHAFQDAIAKASSRVVRSLIVTKPGLAEEMFNGTYETSFGDMCRGLPFDLLRPCLAKLLEVLFDILCSYHCMSVWHEIGLRHAKAEYDRVKIKTATNEHSDPTASTEIPSDEEQEEAEAAQKTVNVLSSVHEILVQSRKVIWDSTARRVRDLLSGPAAVEGEHFLQVMEWCQKFLAAGEAFIKDRSDLLRSIITIQCGKFFQSYHGTNLDALEMILGSEQFVNVSINSEAFKFGSMLSDVLDREDMDGTSADFDVSDFDAWIDRGNPFRVTRRERRRRPISSDIVLGFGGASNMEDDAAAQRLEVDASGRNQRNGLWSSDSLSTAQSISRHNTEPIEEEDDEEEDPEVYGQDIDEETQTVRMNDLHRVESTSQSGLMLTNSAHQILKWLRNYCALLKPLSSKADDIFRGMCDLYDGYFLDVFLFVGGISLQQLVWEDDLITTRLKTTLLRILKGADKYKAEIERIEATKPVSKTTNPQNKFSFEIKSFANRFNAKAMYPVTNGNPQGVYGTTHSPKMSTLSDHQASLLTSSNLYGLKETVVAIGSVQLLSDELTKAKSKIQSLLPTTSARSIENYFGRTIDATEDLRECAFRNASRRMMHAVFDQEKGIAAQISLTPYDTEEPSDSHNPWADTLGYRIGQFSEIMTSTQLPEDMIRQMWEHAMKACSEVMLDGLSMVKRCTMTGRSMMSLDLSYIESNFKFMSPSNVFVNLRIVDTYIKAYYLPWEDLSKWVEVNHAEYGKWRVMSLFHLIVERVNSMEGRILKKQEIRAMQSQIEGIMDQI